MRAAALPLPAVTEAESPGATLALAALPPPSSRRLSPPLPGAARGREGRGARCCCSCTHTHTHSLGSPPAFLPGRQAGVCLIVKLEGEGAERRGEVLTAALDSPPPVAAG